MAGGWLFIPLHYYLCSPFCQPHHLNAYKLCLLNDCAVDNYLYAKSNLLQWFCDATEIPFSSLGSITLPRNIINRSLLPEEAYIKLFINKYFNEIDPQKAHKYSKILGLYLASHQTTLHSNRKIFINELYYNDVKNVMTLIANQKYKFLTSSLIFATDDVKSYLNKYHFSKFQIQDFTDTIEAFKPFFVDAINATDTPLSEAKLNEIVEDICQQSKQGDFSPSIFSHKS